MQFLRVVKPPSPRSVAISRVFEVVEVKGKVASLQVMAPCMTVVRMRNALIMTIIMTVMITFGIIRVIRTVAIVLTITVVVVLFLSWDCVNSTVGGSSYTALMMKLSGLLGFGCVENDNC